LIPSWWILQARVKYNSSYASDFHRERNDRGILWIIISLQETPGARFLPLSRRFHLKILFVHKLFHAYISVSAVIVIFVHLIWRIFYISCLSFILSVSNNLMIVFDIEYYQLWAYILFCALEIMINKMFNVISSQLKDVLLNYKRKKFTSRILFFEFYVLYV